MRINWIREGHWDIDPEDLAEMIEDEVDTTDAEQVAEWLDLDTSEPESEELWLTT